MSDLSELKEILRSHGFVDAAEEIEYARPGAVESWRNYPQCMDQWPLKLRHRRDVNGNIIK